MVSALLLYFMVCEIDLFHFISHPVESATLKSNLPLLKHRLNQTCHQCKKGKHAQLQDNNDDGAFQMCRQVITILERYSVSLFVNLAEYNAFGYCIYVLFVSQKGA